MNIGIIKVLYKETVNCEIKIPDDSVLMKIDYQTVVGYKNHDVYGLLIRSKKSPNEFDKNISETKIKLEGYWYTFVSQCYLEDETLLKDVDTIFKETYIKKTCVDKDLLDELLEELFPLKGEDSKSDFKTDELKKVLNGNLVSITKLLKFEYRGVKIITVDTGYDTFNKKLWNDSTSVSEGFISYDTFIYINDGFSFSSSKDKFLGKECESEFNELYKNTITKYQNIYGINV